MKLAHRKLTMAMAFLASLLFCFGLAFVGRDASARKSDTKPGQGNTTTTRTNNPHGSTTVTTTTTYKDGSTTTTTNYDKDGHDAGTTRVDRQTKDGETTTTTTTYDGNGHETGKTIERVDKDGNKTIIVIDPATGGVKSSTTVPAEKPSPSPGKPLDLPPYKPKWDFKIEPKYNWSPTTSTGYKVETGISPGLNTEIITTPYGKLVINVPDELYGTDTFTGTVLSEPAGKTEAERARNQDQLNGMVLDVGQQKTSVAEKIFTRTIPTNFTRETQTLIVIAKGKTVVNAPIPISNATPPGPPPNPQLPSCGQMGKNVVVRDHCDGVIAPTDSCMIGGTQLQPLAESPRMRVMQNTSQTPGPTQIKYLEQGREVTGSFQNLGVNITSPNTNLLRNQKTTMEVVALVKGIQTDVSLDVVNDSPGIVSISGGNNQHFTIHPSDVQTDGTYHQSFTVTANQAGAWGATATVSCVGAGGPSGPIAAGPRATATPIVFVALGTPTPTPTPGGHPPPPTPTPTASPSPCAPAPTPTTYFVKNLGPLSESDSSKDCRATGVNKAGNVIGVCSPSYFGSSGGSWHAFRTEPGAVIDKEKDELGFPAGIKGGYSFATGINAAGHVVGFWGPGAGVGSEFKAFWHDGSKKSKMISLHPDKSKFTTSKAFAVNSSDDVVGAAYGPTIGPVGLGVTFDGHAVIWPGMDPKSMKDLNDDLDDSVKKDWILKAAFGINDDGDIVGRAYNKKLKKYHAFLLKGMKFIDLGALKEDVSDSSAAYAINECGEKVPAIDKVVGYTFTDSKTYPGKAFHYGFVWTEASGLTDMETVPPYYSTSFIPYLPESYAQAINKKGEVVGASSPAFHTSFFEGDGPGLPGGLCVPASHAIWYNGSELKGGGDLEDLNKLIPGSPGWELDLANGINDAGLIAGSGYYKCFTKTGGGGGVAEGFSKTSRAVLLIPAGFMPPASAPGLKPTAPAPGPVTCPLALPSGGYIFDNWNVCGVKNGPTKDTTFTIDAPYLITFIATYHWNYGKGALPTKGISLKDSSGKVYGPWPVITSAGSGGAANVNWECHPGITLPAGTYTVIDPDPATWSQNDGSGNSGFARVAGSKK